MATARPAPSGSSGGPRGGGGAGHTGASGHRDGRR